MTVQAYLLNSAASAVATACANGQLRILDIGTNVLVSFALGATPFSAPNAGVLSLATALSATASLTGTATTYVLLASDLSTVLASGSVSLSSGSSDVRLSTTSVTSGSTVSLSTLTLAVAP